MTQSKTNAQHWVLVILRIAIGWHLLYEGITKLANPNWSSVGYLLDSKGIFAGIFQSMTENPGLVNVVDFINIWGLVLFGAALILGSFTRIAIFGSITLLSLYYLSHPPLLHATYALPSEGSYMFVNKNLIEIISLVVLLLFPTWHSTGIDRFIFRKRAYSD